MFGMDIVSLDIQRSRDHGIPSYTQFRKFCGLKEIKNVQDLTKIMVKGVSFKKCEIIKNRYTVLIILFLYVLYSQLIDY